MIGWLKTLFLGKPKIKRKRKIYPIETYKCCADHTLKRQRTDDIAYGGGGMGWRRITHPARTINLRQYRYWCSCGTLLTPGPSGGAAVCAVCEKCRINYGADLPGYWGN